jgi:hypothetical protein
LLDFLGRKVRVFVGADLIAAPAFLIATFRAHQDHVEDMKEINFIANLRHYASVLLRRGPWFACSTDPCLSIAQMKNINWVECSAVAAPGRGRIRRRPGTRQGLTSNDRSGIFTFLLHSPVPLLCLIEKVVDLESARR